MCVADVAVEGSLGTKQIEGVIFARIPKDLASVHFKGDAQYAAVLVLLLDARADLVAQGQVICANDEIAVLFSTCEGRNGKTTIDDSKRGSVLEEARGAVLNADESWREDGEACPAARHDGFFLRQRIPLFSRVNK